MNTSLLEAIGRELLRVSLLAAGLTLGVALLLALMRGLAPRWRAWVWWLVAARLLAELAGAPALELPLLVSARPARPAPAVTIDSPILPAQTLSRVAWAPDSKSSSPAASAVNAWQVAALVWLAGLGVAGLLLTREARRLAALVRRADPVTDPASRAALDRAAERAGARAPVRLLRSEEVAAPMVVGLLRPAILVPSERELTGEDLALALEHELVHVRRGDAWRALAPALTRHLLFFHPLVRLAEREYRLATEAACDAEVLTHASELSERYGRLLVRFAAAGRVPAAPAGAWSFAASPIFRRLDMMAEPSMDRRRLALVAPILVLLAAALAVPLRLVAAPTPAPPPTPAPTTTSAPAPEALPAPETPTPRVAPAPRSPRAGSRAGDRWSWAPAPPAPPVPAVAPLPAVAPAPASAPVPAAFPALALLPPLPPIGEIEAVDALVLVDGDTHFSMDATREERRLAYRLAEEAGEPVALVKRDGRLFVVRDARTIAEIQDALGAQAALARRQGEVARDQAGVARRQAQIAAEHARAEARRMQSQAREDARRMADAARLQTERSAALARELAEFGASPEVALSAERLRDIERQLDELQRDLERLRVDGSSMPAVDEGTTERLERELRAEMERFESRQEALAREMRHQGAEVGRRISEALDRAFDDGLALPIERPRP